MNAEHVYEWLRMYWLHDEDKFGNCPECTQLGRRLERFIGPASVRFVERIIRKNPGRKATPKPHDRFATNVETKRSGKRMMIKHRNSLAKLAKG